MAYEYNGITRSLRVLVNKVVEGLQVQGYPKTYDGQLAGYTWGNPAFAALTTTELSQISDADFTTRYNAFVAYVEAVEGCEFDTDISGDGAIKANLECLLTTTTTTTAIPEIIPTYYVSSFGNDSNAGTTTGTAWKTISKVNSSTFQPGGSILFERGGVWREQLRVPSSGSSGNPIVFGAYGSGNKPLIDGADIISGMTSSGSNIWQKTGITTRPFIMFLNGTLGILKNSVVACITEGDWFWDSGTNVFSVYTTGGNPGGDIELGQRKELINAANRHYITVSNLTLQHSNENNIDLGSSLGALAMTTGSNLTVTGCTIQDNSLHGLMVINSSNVIVDNNVFLRNGLDKFNGHNAIIKTLNANGSNYKFTNNISSYAGLDGVLIRANVTNTALTNVEISGNTFEYNNAAGAYPIRCDYVAIFNNYFYGNGNPNHVGEDYGIGIESCSNTDVYQNTVLKTINNDAIQVYGDLPDPAHNVRIFKNYISGADGDGIGLAHWGENGLKNIEVFYNIIDSCGEYGISASHNTTAGIDTIEVYNNVINNCKKEGVFLYANYPIILKNNIFTNNASPDINAYGSTTGLTISNNLYSRTSGYCISLNATGYTPATVLNIEPSAVLGNPLFTNAANNYFSLQTGSPAINAGIDVGLTTDFVNNPIVGTPDIGCYEYQP